LKGSLALLPLAPISNVKAADLSSLVEAMRVRIQNEVSASNAASLWSAAEILSGLLYTDEYSQQLFGGAWNMQESTVYQRILAEGEAKGVVRGKVEGKAEGKAEGEREMLLLFGRHKLGEPDASTLATIERINSVPKLQELATRLLNVSTWQDLLR